MHLSIIVPAYNEEPNIPALHRRLTAAAAEALGRDRPADRAHGAHGRRDGYEIIYIDDGSTDGTAAAVQRIAAADPSVRLIALSRNFGHEAASTAGLDHARGEAVVLIDADLQDPPELIPRMLDRWRAGADVVYAQRRRREGEPLIKRLTAHLFYRVLARLTDTPIPRDTGDFRLMDRRVVQAVRRCREAPRFVRGLVAWVGFHQEAILYDRDPRHAGRTKYGLLKLLRLSAVAISSFSLVPLRLSIHLGLLMLLVSAAFASVIVAQRLFFGVEMFKGYAFLTCSVFFLGGVQLTMLGIIAHYLGQVFTQGQRRPLYIVADHTGFPDDAPDALRRDGGAGEQVLVVRRQTPDHHEPAGEVHAAAAGG